jgi:hypothetical protein
VAEQNTVLLVAIPKIAALRGWTTYSQFEYSRKPFQICNMLQIEGIFVEADLIGDLIGASWDRAPPIGNFMNHCKRYCPVERSAPFSQVRNVQGRKFALLEESTSLWLIFFLATTSGLFWMSTSRIHIHHHDGSDFLMNNWQNRRGQSLATLIQFSSKMGWTIALVDSPSHHTVVAIYRWGNENWTSGVVAVVTVEDFYGFARGLLKPSSRVTMERTAGIGCTCSKVVAANRAHFRGLHFLHTTRRNFCERVIPRVCESISTEV